MEPWLYSLKILSYAFWSMEGILHFPEELKDKTQVCYGNCSCTKENIHIYMYFSYQEFSIFKVILHWILHFFTDHHTPFSLFIQAQLLNLTVPQWEQFKVKSARKQKYTYRSWGAKEWTEEHQTCQKQSGGLLQITAKFAWNYARQSPCTGVRLMITLKLEFLVCSGTGNKVGQCIMNNKYKKHLCDSQLYLLNTLWNHF